MSIADSRLDKVAETVSLHRKKGDALRRRNRQADAEDAYRVALSSIDAALSGEDVAQFSPADMAELWGMRGGLLRRLGRIDEALESYNTGSAIEIDAPLAATYNRSNAMKLALISGARTLASLDDDLRALEAAIEATIRNDVRAASDAWTYADLGDTQLLLGKVAEAVESYEVFAKRARTDSPTTTLTVLREIVDALALNRDPAAAELAADLDRVERLLSRR